MDPIMTPVVAQLLLEVTRAAIKAATAARAEGKDLETLLAEAVRENEISVFDKLGVEKP